MRPKDRFSPLEFALVIGTAFGWSILFSVYALILGTTVGESASQQSFGNAHLLGVVVQEALLAPVPLAVLWVRGWRVADFRLGASISATAAGFAIYVAALVANFLINLLLQAAFPVAESALEALGAYRPSTGPTLATVVLVSLVNPVFEEVFVCAYVVEALRPRFGVTAAINASVVIRASYHLYQGIPAFPFHCAYGLLQAYVYARFGRLWPLIVSHALLDFAAFVQLT